MRFQAKPPWRRLRWATVWLKISALLARPEFAKVDSADDEPASA
jgi:hypothetical protein